MALIREHLLKVAFTTRFCYATVIRRTDPLSQGTEVVSASTLEPEIRELLKKDNKSTSDTHAAALVGRLLAQRALQMDLSSVHFQFARDERYHGKLKALLDSVQESGVQLK
jgi:large subunit ribosomal protein L18